MSAPEWNETAAKAWATVYFGLQARGQESYFYNRTGFLRCHADALAGKEPGPTHWALFVAQRMRL